MINVNTKTNTATFQNLAKSDRYPPQYFDENEDT